MPKKKPTVTIEGFTPLPKLDLSVYEAVTCLSKNETRNLVNFYYQVQKLRLQLEGQLRALAQGVDEAAKLKVSEEDSVKAESSAFVSMYFYEYIKSLEKQVKDLLGYWTNKDPVGLWLKSIMGIGPVISAGLLAHIDITKVKTAGGIERFGGIDPTLPKLQKGVKRGWNAELKVLLYKAGESFVKVKNKPNDFYGKIYQIRKEYETAKNENGDYADQAAQALKDKTFINEDIKKIYQSGKLPPGHIHSRCRRYCTKIFVSHLFQVLYWNHHKVAPPKPYVIHILNHVDEILVPNFNMQTGKILVDGIEDIRSKWVEEEVDVDIEKDEFVDAE